MQKVSMGFFNYSFYFLWDLVAKFQGAYSTFQTLYKSTEPFILISELVVTPNFTPFHSETNTFQDILTSLEVYGSRLINLKGCRLIISNSQSFESQQNLWDLPKCFEVQNSHRKQQTPLFSMGFRCKILVI
jgi:hypothetical protein